MRIYHIGLPKTGTTSLQVALQSNCNYTGTFQPRTNNQGKHIYQALTEFILGMTDEVGVELPEHFIYSEEEVLVNSYENKVAENLNRLFSILTPEDRVLISTRQTESAIVSAYYEFYRFLEHIPLNDIMKTCWLKPYVPGYIESIIPPDYREQVIFASLESGFDNFRAVIDDSVFNQLQKNKHENKRKEVGNLIEVYYYWSPFSPSIARAIDIWFWNPICNLQLLPLRRDLFSRFKRIRKRFIDPVTPQKILTQD